MPRKAKIGTEKTPYCSNRECIDMTCERNRKYMPYNVLLWTENFVPDKNGKCKGRIT